MSQSSSDQFWSGYVIADADVEYLYGYLLERGMPAPSRELTPRLIEFRTRAEEKRRAELAARAPQYQPKKTYTLGQPIIFPALNNRTAVVTALRDSDNPRLGAFQVVKARFDDSGQEREFAASYPGPHPLNEEPVTNETFLLSPADALAQYGEQIRARLQQRLTVDPEFIGFDDQWLLRGLLTEINVGHLNLAEAAIEHANDAMTTAELLRVLDLPDGAKRATVMLSLNHALEVDERFANVGPQSEARWYLTRLVPENVRSKPAVLNLMPTPTSPAPLPAELQAIIAELHDESEVNGSNQGPAAPPAAEVTIVLTYPHRRAGTIPLTRPVSALFAPPTQAPMKITLVNAQTAERWPGWVVPAGSYLAGLENFYAAHKLNPGAIITLRRGQNPLTVSIEIQSQRERSLWVRVARVQNQRLIFTQEKRPVAHKYDDEMLIVLGDSRAVDTLFDSGHGARSLAAVVEELFPELAKLSSAGHVHAKTLYAAANLVQRVGPRAVFEAVVANRAFASAGGGYFVLEISRSLVR